MAKSANLTAKNMYTCGWCGKDHKFVKGSGWALHQRQMAAYAAKQRKRKRNR